MPGASLGAQSLVTEDRVAKAGYFTCLTGVDTRRDFGVRSLRFTLQVFVFVHKKQILFPHVKGE